MTYRFERWKSLFHLLGLHRLTILQVNDMRVQAATEAGNMSLTYLRNYWTSTLAGLWEFKAGRRLTSNEQINQWIMRSTSWKINCRTDVSSDSERALDNNWKTQHCLGRCHLTSILSSTNTLWNTLLARREDNLIIRSISSRHQSMQLLNKASRHRLIVHLGEVTRRESSQSKLALRTKMKALSQLNRRSTGSNQLDSWGDPRGGLRRY